MASPCRLLLLPLLSVVLASVTEGRNLHVVRHHAPLQHTTVMVGGAAALCQHADFPDLCLSVSKSVRTLTLQSLANAVIMEALVKTQAAEAQVTKLMAVPGTSTMMKAYLQVCQEGFGSATGALQEALGHLKGARSYPAVMNPLSDALTFVEDCSDGFNERPTLVCPIDNINTNLRKLVSNSLALAHATLKKNT